MYVYPCVVKAKMYYSILIYLLLFSYFVGPIYCKNLTSAWHKAYICKTTETEILSCHIYHMMNVLIKCQILYCTVVTSILKVTLSMLS